MPFLLTLKGHIPLKAVELYGGLGIGFYFAKIYIDANAPIGSASFSDRDTVFEYHCLAGINFNITKTKNIYEQKRTCSKTNSPKLRY